MPNFDRTGPRGEGQRTGGGFGLCTGEVARQDMATVKDDAPRGLGRGGRPWGGGRGRGFGGGRGRGYGQGRLRRRRWPRVGDEVAPLERASESALELRIEQLLTAIERLTTRVDELERGAEK